MQKTAPRFVPLNLRTTGHAFTSALSRAPNFFKELAHSSRSSSAVSAAT